MMAGLSLRLSPIRGSRRIEMTELHESLLTLANAGNVKAQYLLGRCFLSGVG